MILLCQLIVLNECIVWWLDTLVQRCLSCQLHAEDFASPIRDLITSFQLPYGFQVRKQQLDFQSRKILWSSSKYFVEFSAWNLFFGDLSIATICTIHLELVTFCWWYFLSHPTAYLQCQEVIGCLGHGMSEYDTIPVGQALRSASVGSNNALFTLCNNGLTIVPRGNLYSSKIVDTSRTLQKWKR